MLPLRLFAVYDHFPQHIPAVVTSSLSLILTFAAFPTLSCQIYFNHIDQKNTKAFNITAIR